MSMVEFQVVNVCLHCACDHGIEYLVLDDGDKVSAYSTNVRRAYPCKEWERIVTDIQRKVDSYTLYQERFSTGGMRASYVRRHEKSRIA